MNSNNFFQKNKKVLMAAVGLIVICIVMLSWKVVGYRGRITKRVNSRRIYRNHIRRGELCGDSF